MHIIPISALSIQDILLIARKIKIMYLHHWQLYVRDIIQLQGGRTYVKHCP